MKWINAMERAYRAFSMAFAKVGTMAPAVADDYFDAHNPVAHLIEPQMKLDWLIEPQMKLDWLIEQGTGNTFDQFGNDLLAGLVIDLLVALECREQRRALGQGWPLRRRAHELEQLPPPR